MKTTFVELFKAKKFRVRHFKPEDAGECEEFLSDPDVMKFIGDGNFDFKKTSGETMVNWFIKSYENQLGLGTWAIVNNENDRVIGNCHLSNCSPAQKVEFGLALAKSSFRAT